MKRFNKSILIAITVVMTLGLLVGCNLILSKLGLKDKFLLASSEISLKVGEEYEITLADNSVKESFKLVSADESKVVIVGNSKIKGVAKTEQPVTVTATSDSGKEAEVSVKVNYADVTEIGISTSGGRPIQIVGGGQTAQAVVFNADTNAHTDPATAFEWRVTDKMTGEQVDEASGKSFSFTPAVLNTTYVVSVTADGVTSSVECGFYNHIYLSADKAKYKANEDVFVNVVFAIPDNFTGSTAEFDVYINGVFKKGVTTAVNTAGVNEASINIGSFSELGTYNIKLLFNGGYSNEISVEITEFTAADHITVTAENPALLQQRGVSPQVVEFTAALNPVTANPEAIEWYVNGVKRTSGASFGFRPSSFGEYHVEAKINKVSSGRTTVVYLGTADDRTEFAENSFDYGGWPQNRYITDQTELNNAILHATENQLYGSANNRLELYIDYPSALPVKERIEMARNSSSESGILPGYEYTESGKVFGICFDYTLDNGRRIINSPTADAPDAVPNIQQSGKSLPHYTSALKTRSFYIDTQTRTMDVYTSNMLYKAVMWGYNPVFKGSGAVSLQAMYNNARSVLSTIISDDMSEYEKVHAINDWIIYNVRYDHDLVEATGGSNDPTTALNNKMSYYGYYLEGVFKTPSDRHAVCDGKSKAFVLMCGIEGITALRIAGDAGEGTDKGGHAWNKVLLDIDGDGEKDWFVIDTTWGDKNSQGTDNVTREYLSHSYFLLSDSDIADTHIESGNHSYPKAEGKYDYYAYAAFKYNGKDYSHKIDEGTPINTTQNQLNALFKHSVQNSIKYIEFEASFIFNQQQLEELEAMLQRALGFAGYSGAYAPSFARDNIIAVILN